MNPFETIHEENWDKEAVIETFKKMVSEKVFNCFDAHNPYQIVEFTQRTTAPINLMANCCHREHLHNVELGLNQESNSNTHELYMDVLLIHVPQREETKVTWNIVTTFPIDEGIPLDFLLSKHYVLKHHKVSNFLYDFDRISYNVLSFVRGIKQIYHKPSFAILNE